MEIEKPRISKPQAKNALSKVLKNLDKIDRYVIKDIEEISE
jgi:hypothetical protein